MVLMSELSDYIPTFNTEQRKAYDEGRAAHANGVDFFDGPYMYGKGSHSLDHSWSLGWFDAQDGVTPEQRFNPNMDDTDNPLGNCAWE